MAKIIKICALPVILLMLSTFLFGCTAKIEAKTVYEKILEYAKADNNIFEVSQVGDDSTNLSISIKIGYTDTINEKLIEEQLSPKSDFYLLKEVYEPTLNFSLYFFLKNFKFLQTSNKVINKEDAWLVYEKFNKLKKSIDAFQTSLASLNYYEDSFANNAYLNRKGMVYRQFDNFKVKYGLLIKDCFELNDQFIQAYYTVYHPTDYRDNTNSNIDGLYIQMLCSEITDKLSYVGFLVDGVKCNFSNTNKSSFEIENEAEPIDHTYIKHMSSISQTSKSLINKESSSFQQLNNNEAIKEEIVILQNQYDIFKAQLNKFIKALNSIDYKDYVASNKNLEDYASTLNNTKKSYLYVVEDFLENSYKNLINQVDEILSKVN